MGTLINMNKLQKLLSSRTFWAVVVIVALNTVNAVADMFDPTVLNTLTLILGALASYFKVNPSQNYSD